MTSIAIITKLYNRAIYLHDLLIKIRDTIIQYPSVDSLAVHTDITVFQKELETVKLVSNNFLVSEISDISDWLSECSTEQVEVRTALETCDKFIKQIDVLLACFSPNAFPKE